jgi:hypothetical protein
MATSSDLTPSTTTGGQNLSRDARHLLSTPAATGASARQCEGSQGTSHTALVGLQELVCTGQLAPASVIEAEAGWAPCIGHVACISRPPLRLSDSRSYGLERTRQGPGYRAR